MMRMHSPLGKVGGLLILLLAIAVIALPGSAAAMGSEGRLSPRLAKLATPELRGASPDRQARALSLVSRGPGSLLRRGNRVLVYVRFDHGAVAGADDLRAVGAETVAASRRYQVDTVAAEPSQLPGLTAVPGVTSVQPAYAPIVAEATPPVAATTPYEPCFGAETSEGDGQLGAAKARAEFEVAGTGTRVGILSDSFDQDPLAPTGATEDVRSGDLPGAKDPCGELTPMEVLDDTETSGEDEGRAMAQIVHDLAPGAAISFATAFTGEPEFAENIRALAAKEASIIVDDVTYLEEPFFQEGPVGVAISEVSENDDVAYYTAAGNNNSFDGSNEIGSWEAPEFRDSKACPKAVEELGASNPSLKTGHCMDFDPSGEVDRTFGIAVEPEEKLTIDLQWAEPWEGVTTDLDAYLLDGSGKVVRTSTEQNTAPVAPENQQPFEILGWENQSSSTAVVRLVINRRAGSGARLKFILAQNGGGVAATEYEKSSGGDVVGPTIFGHNGSEHAMSIGAIRQNTNSKPEFFSSRGPVTHYFEAATGSGSGPAAELSSPQVISKPDVVASDGGADTFFGICNENAWRFFGTSAAAPHAAAVAALEREAAPVASAEEVEQAQREAALTVGAFPSAAVGSGLINTPGTLEALGLTASDPGASVAEPPPPGPCTPAREPRKESSGVTPLPPTSPSPPTEEPPKRAPNPKTFFLQRPSKIIRTHHDQAKAVFRFGSNESEASFVCRVDGSFFRPCPARLARRFTLGWHVLKVAARNAAGNGDRTPASYSFKVKRVR
jgi:subtilisin family serine protease